ncbi:MAG TPA: ROK family protein [Mycobacteriales bacterium]|nr:ROK family protein [Mycobacteriales bacterium]
MDVLRPVLAVDIGGSKLAAALVGADGAVVRAERVPTGPDPWPALRDLLERVRAGEAVRGVGVACPGPVRWPEGVVSPPNFPAWQDGFPLLPALRAAYPGLPVRMHNDAVAVAVGEHWKGAGRGVPDLLGMVASTGVGGGIVTGGRVLPGRSGNAGHVGHLVVEVDGPACGCGGRGCVEAVARGPALVAWARERGSPATDGRELAEAAAAGEPVALAALARGGRALGAGIAGAAALLDVELVVLGGGLSQSGPALWEPLLASVAEHAALGYLTGLRVVPTALGQDSGLVGAAAFVHAAETYDVPG